MSSFSEEVVETVVAALQEAAKSSDRKIAGSARSALRRMYDERAELAGALVQETPWNVQPSATKNGGWLVCNQSDMVVATCPAIGDDLESDMLFCAAQSASAIVACVNACADIPLEDLEGCKLVPADGLPVGYYMLAPV